VERYIRNMNALTPEENANLIKHKVCVIGCGGLGGYIIEMLGRLGIGYITAVDGDCFDESNLNRQILSDSESVGEGKALKAFERMQRVNPFIKINPIQERLTLENCCRIISGHDVVVDALDNIDTRIILQREAEKLNIPLVHGAISGWYGQVTTIFSGDRTLDLIYQSKDSETEGRKLGNPSFTPALIASIEVSEVVKILIGRGELLRKKLLFIDLLLQEYQIINL
jgi:molybdopterin/thiamine biosynthesis adenylyltransferase